MFAFNTPQKTQKQSVLERINRKQAADQSISGRIVAAIENSRIPFRIPIPFSKFEREILDRTLCAICSVIKWLRSHCYLK